MQKPLKLDPNEEKREPSLPGGWELVDVLSEEIDLSGCKILTAGLAARHQEEGTLVTGSAASWTQDPAPLAGYELMERIGIVEALRKPADHPFRLIDPERGGTRGEVRNVFIQSPEPEIWRPARSNGVAIGGSWQQASQHALFEALERHLVLASWYGQSLPRRVPSVGELAGGWPRALAPLSRRYRLEHYIFGSVSSSASRTPIWVSGSFLWPLKPEGLLIYGFGAGPSEEEALQKSLREAVQRLCFLDGSELPDAAPAFEPTPDYHQAFYLHPLRHPTLRAWLDGGFFQKSAGHGKEGNLVRLRDRVQFVDLTPPNFENLFVVKAIAESFIPLCFGRCPHPGGHPLEDEDLLIHPIV